MLLNCPSCNTQYLLKSVDLHPEGKKPMTARQFLAGAKLSEGDYFD